jgi:hypothetical protein
MIPVGKIATNPTLLASLINSGENSDTDEHGRDLFDRLGAQEGVVRAAEMWTAACRVLDGSAVDPDTGQITVGVLRAEPAGEPS